MRMPIRGRKRPGRDRSRKLPGKVTAGGTTSANPADHDLIGLAMQNPSASVAGRCASCSMRWRSRGFLHVDHEHAAAAPREGASPGLDGRLAEAGPHRSPGDSFDPET